MFFSVFLVFGGPWIVFKRILSKGKIRSLSLESTTLHNVVLLEKPFYWMASFLLPLRRDTNCSVSNVERIELTMRNWQSSVRTPSAIVSWKCYTIDRLRGVKKYITSVSNITRYNNLSKSKTMRSIFDSIMFLNLPQSNSTNVSRKYSLRHLHVNFKYFIEALKLCKWLSYSLHLNCCKESNPRHFLKSCPL